MEWLSVEEKSRTMIPYLLDLPPLDKVTDAKKATITELPETKEERKTKKKTKEVELEK